MIGNQDGPFFRWICCGTIAKARADYQRPDVPRERHALVAGYALSGVSIPIAYRESVYRAEAYIDQERSARWWIHQTDDGLCSFVWTCGVLGFDSDAVRERIVATRAAQYGLQPWQRRNDMPPRWYQCTGS